MYYATDTTSVLMALLWQIEKVHDKKITVERLVEIYKKFQEEKGMCIYGPIGRANEIQIQEDLEVDLKELVERNMIHYDSGGVSVTVLAAPVAANLVLPSPLPRLVQLAQGNHS